jgi:NAD(P)-dependent dehydrogenase (short-subunit alcohol dehydrogenase family)
MSNSSDKFNLSGKNILITGASSGLGKDAALLLAECGGGLILTGRDEKRLNDTFNALNGKGHKKIIADITIENELTELVNQIDELDSFVFSAGITGYLPAKFMNQKHIDDFFKINFNAPVMLTQKLLAKRKIKKGASLVYISSIATKYPYFGGSMYISSKMALEGYCKTLAVELGNDGTRVNCVSPAMVKTKMLEKASDVVSKESIESFKKLHPLGFGEPRDVSSAIMFLISDASKWITGQNLILGGI